MSHVDTIEVMVPQPVAVLEVMVQQVKQVEVNVGVPGPAVANFKLTASTTPPANPSINDIWIDIS